MNKKVATLSSILLVASSGVTAWGPLLETAGKGTFVRPTSQLSARRREVENDVEIKTYRVDFEDLFQSSQMATGRDILGLVEQRASDLARESFEEMYEQDFCKGDDCDLECPIPDDWAKSYGAMDATEVMAFLNIQRAKPLL